MPLRIGSDEIAKVYFGSDEVSKVYVGSDEAFGAAPAYNFDQTLSVPAYDYGAEYGTTLNTAVSANSNVTATGVITITGLTPAYVVRPTQIRVVTGGSVQGDIMYANIYRDGDVASVAALRVYSGAAVWQTSIVGYYHGNRDDPVSVPYTIRIQANIAAA